MIATLPMYDLPETAAHTDRLWTALAERLRAAGLAGVPDGLRRDDERAALLDPSLLLAQTCGFPLTHALAGRLRYVATPCYAAPGCAGGFYRSAFLVRASTPTARLAELRDVTFAFNGRDSQSGWNAPLHALAGAGPGAPAIARLLETGAHAASLQAVAAGAADLCAVDCVSLALLRRHRPAALDGLRVLAWTAPAPGLPYVTRVDADDGLVRRLQTALDGVLADPALAATRAALLLVGAEVLPVSAYRRILDMEIEASKLGIAALA